jgi:RNA polymerase primary sigma factor
MLAHVPAAEHILEALEKDIVKSGEEVDVPELAELLRIARLAKKSKKPGSEDARWQKLCAELASKIRLPDSDRIWMTRP